MMQMTRLSAFLLFLIYSFCSFGSVFAQNGEPPAKLEQELQHLLNAIKEKGNQNQYPAVEKAMDRMIVVMKLLGHPEEDIAQRAHLRIRYSLSIGRIFAARNSAEAWLEKHPDDLIGLDLFATAATNMARYLEARPALQTVYESDPANAFNQKRLLYVLKKLNDREEGLRLCRAILGADPKDERAAQDAIDGLLLFGENQEALQSLPILTSLNPTSSFAHYARGVVLQEVGRLEDAIQSFSQVSSEADEHGDSVFRQGLCYLQSRHYAPAAYRFIELLARDPFKPNYHTNLAQSLARLKKREGAKLVQAINKRLSKEFLPQGEANYMWRNGDMVEYARLQSIAMNLKGEFRAAQTLLENTCRLVPDSMQATKNLGQHYFTTLQANKAESTFRKLLEKVPPGERPAIQRKLSEALLRQDRPAETLASAEALGDASLKESHHALIGTYYLEIKNDPGNALAHLSLIPNATHSVVAAQARCWVELGDAGKAFGCFDKLPQDYGDPALLMAKSRGLAMRGETQKAQDLYQGVMAEHPDLSPLISVPARAALASASDMETWRQRSAAIQQSAKAIQQNVIRAQRQGWPASIPTLSELSEQYNLLGANDEAALFARRAYEGDPTRDENLLRLIDRMTDKQRIFERYHLILRAQADPGIQRDFSKEIQEIHSHLQIPPPSDRAHNHDSQ